MVDCEGSGCGSTSGPKAGFPNNDDHRPRLRSSHAMHSCKKTLEARGHKDESAVATPYAALIREGLLGQARCLRCFKCCCFLLLLL